MATPTRKSSKRNTPSKRASRKVTPAKRIRPKDRSVRHGPDYGGHSPRHSRSKQRRVKEATHKYDRVEPKEHNDQSGVPVGHVRVYCSAPNGSSLSVKIIERVAHKHDLKGMTLRPYQRVYRGHAFRTASGLQQGDIMRWKGKLVSRHAHAAAMKNWSGMSSSLKRKFQAAKFSRSRSSRSRSHSKSHRRGTRTRQTTNRLNLGGHNADAPDSDGYETDEL